MRGHEEQEGYIMQLLKLRAKIDSDITSWLQKKTNFLTPEYQNEVLDDLSDNILSSVVKEVRDRPNS